MSIRPITRVAAAVIVRRDGRVLLAQRPEGKVYAGYWEFPGGKLEPGESPRAALDRELREELGLEVTRASSWLLQRYEYAHADVELHFFRVWDWAGEPVGHDGQAFAWQAPDAIDVAPLLPANTRVLAALRLPARYGISCAEDLGEEGFLARAETAFAGGLRLAVLREPGWAVARREALAKRLLPLGARYGTKLLWHGDAARARALGFAGVHWRADVLASATSRPEGMMVVASCHTREEIAQAGRLGLDFVVAGPVRATPTHPDAMPLGDVGFARLVEGATLPVFALGGLAPSDLEAMIAIGAQGVAMRRAAWPAP